MYQARVIADSKSSITGDRLTTIEVTYPRYIHAEMCRHRNQARNSASSRAIPTKTILANTLADPVLPLTYGQNRAGMSAGEELSSDKIAYIQERLLYLADVTAEVVQDIANVGLHKQNANRYMESFVWHTEIISATTWSNFFALRISEYAQPEIHYIAKLMKEALDKSVPKTLSWRDWHLPFVSDEELLELDLEDAKKVSLARCSRASYNRQNAVKELEEDRVQYDRLTTNGHWSCAEHIATPRPGRSGPYVGFHQLRKDFANEDDFSKMGL